MEKNVKVYRAATLREALEQIKREMGEDALVLDHRRIRAGGLFGLGARELVEVEVSQPAAYKCKTLLGLEDDEPTMPTYAQEDASKPNSPRPGPALAAYAARAYRSDPAIRSAPKSDKPAPKADTASKPEPKDPRASADQAADEAGVGLKEVLATRVEVSEKSMEAIVGAKAARPPDNSIVSELHRLRAELREIKFSLAAFGRPAQDKGSEAVDFDSCPEIYDSPYYEAYMDLTSTGLAPGLAKQAIKLAVQFTANVGRIAARRDELTYVGLSKMLGAELRFAEDLLAEKAEAKEINKIADITRLDKAAQPVMAFIGPTGVGKTTTIAKLAAQAVLRAHQRVELITLDTYRIAAVDQLKTYAELIGAGFNTARSVMELDALQRRLRGLATVLIDTAGRNPFDLVDQLELADYLRKNGDITKCLVLQATTHPADTQVAIRKFALYDPNQLVITKLDETTRPGAAVSAVTDARLPLAYICAGQRVPEDIERATPTAFAARILRAALLAAAA